MRPFISLSLDSFLKDFMSFWCFVFFRCLIYKVRARSLFVPDGDSLYHFVTSLSSPFLNLFSGLSRPSSRPFGPALRPLSSELCHLTTLSRSCQVLFSLPIKLFYQFFLGSCLAAERSVNIPNTAAIVNTFFDFFCLFSSGPLCHNISCPAAAPDHYSFSFGGSTMVSTANTKHPAGSTAWGSACVAPVRATPKATNTAAPGQ